MATASDINPLISWGFNRKRQMMRNAFNENKGTAAPLVNKILYGALGPFIKMWTGSIWDRVALWAQNNEFTGTNKFGSATDYLQIDNAGNLSLIGNATVFDDFQVPMSNIKAPASDPPTWTSYKGCELPAFGAGNTNVLYFTAQFPHKWKAGSTIEPHIHLSYPNANAGNSRWQFTYSWANIDGTFPAQTTVTQTFAAPAVTDKHTYNSFGGITATNFTASSVMLCSISRLGADAADTYASNIYAVSMDIHIEQDKLGDNTV